MGSYFSVGALALAAEGANAVGAVRFTLREDVLEIDLLRVGSYRESFLPGALTEAVRFAVPYTAVRGLVRRGAVLYLALDAKVASPYHRFALTRFSDAPLDGLVGAHHRRMRARLAAVLVPAPASTLALVLAPEWLVAGALGKASLAVVVALGTWALFRALLSVRTHGGPLSDEFRDAFEHRMLERLGLRPAWLADEAPFDAPLAHAAFARAESAPRPLRAAAAPWGPSRGGTGARVGISSPVPTAPQDMLRGATFEPAGGPRARTAGHRGRFADAASYTPAPTIVAEGWDATESFPSASAIGPGASSATATGTADRGAGTGSARPGAPLAIVRATPEVGRPPAAPVPPMGPSPTVGLPLVEPETPWARAIRSTGARRGALVALAAAALGVLALSAGRTLATRDAPSRAVAGSGVGPVDDDGAAEPADASSARHPGASRAAPPPTAARAVSSSGRVLTPCSCERGDSPLWSSPPPVLSILPIPTRRGDGPLPDDISPRIDARGRGRYEFDIAIVNNGKDDLADIRLVLTFARRDARGDRAGVTDRGLFWEGALGPGRSVKWSVKAPGTEVRIDADEKRTLADVRTASGDAFFGLLRARQAAVRLHGATMLAYVGDKRAETAARQLDGLSKPQELVREMVVRAASPLRVCGAKVQGETLQVCIDNTTDDALVSPELVEPTPGGRRAKVEATIPPHSGGTATFESFGAAAEELVVQR